MKNILLIGGSYGIGLAIAKELQFEKIKIIAESVAAMAASGPAGRGGGGG